MAEGMSEEKLIAVMGQTGAGKSTFVRIATGDESVEVGHTLSSVTQEISAHRVEIGNQQVVLLDTPGFDDTYRSDTDVLKDLAFWLAESYVSGRQLTAILLLHRITDIRMSGSSMRNLLMFRKLIGDETLRNVVLVTTMWTMVDEADGAARERTLLNTPQFWGDMISHGSSAARFDCTREGAWSIIQSQLYKTRRPLNIQKEMIDARLDLADTAAGKELQARMKEMTVKYQEGLDRLQSDMQAALRQQDRAAVEALARLSEEQGHKLAIAQAQIDALQYRNPEIEALQAKHEQEMKSLRESLEDRMRFLEEMASSPPPAYVAVQSTADENDRLSTQPVASHNTNMFSFIKFHLWNLYIFSTRRIQILSRPRIPAGYRRLEWTCTCGELLYGDFREGSPGSLDAFAARLREHTGRGIGQSSSSLRAGLSTDPRTSPKAQSRNSTHPLNWSLPNRRDDGNRNPGDSSNHASSGRVGSPARPIREALQLCIETGKYSLELEELELDKPQSDGILFERIRHRYEHASHSILPIRLRFRKPERVVFIKFRVSKRPLVSPMAGSIEAPSIPPVDEVKAGNYKYDPCPIDEPPIDYRTFFHHFYSPASQHSDVMWGPQLPRKLGPGLGPMAQGWGIHLEEYPDWPLFALLNLMSLLVSGAIAGIYSWKKGDTQTGIAIGVWLTAVQTLLVTAVFFWWT